MEEYKHRLHVVSINVGWAMVRQIVRVWGLVESARLQNENT